MRAAMNQESETDFNFSIVNGLCLAAVTLDGSLRFYQSESQTDFTQFKDVDKIDIGPKYNDKHKLTCVKWSKSWNPKFDTLVAVSCGCLKNANHTCETRIRIFHQAD